MTETSPVTNPLTTPWCRVADGGRADDAHAAHRRPAVRRGSGLRRGATGARPHPDRPRRGAGRHAGDRGGCDRAAGRGVRQLDHPGHRRRGVAAGLHRVGRAGQAAATRSPMTTPTTTPTTTPPMTATAPARVAVR